MLLATICINHSDFALTGLRESGQMSRMRWDRQTDGRTFPLIHLRRLLRSAADKNEPEVKYYIAQYMVPSSPSFAFTAKTGVHSNNYVTCPDTFISSETRACQTLKMPPIINSSIMWLKSFVFIIFHFICIFLSVPSPCQFVTLDFSIGGHR